MAKKPNKIEILPYNVYFGDCFLVLFHYQDESQKSVLIDFGSTGKGKHGQDPDDDADADETLKESTGERLLRVANDINERTKGKDTEKEKGKLDVVVATHRHKDHIYGFGLKAAGKIILDLDPEIVIQPWTENPKDNRDLSKGLPLLHGADFREGRTEHFTAMLDDMHDVAEAIEAEAKKLGNSTLFSKTINQATRNRIVFAANDNKKIRNKAAVDNLAKMRNPHYVHFGYDKINWEKILPGVKVHILGPPLIGDAPDMLKAKNKHDEFWSLMAMNKFFWGVLAATNSGPNLARHGRPPIFGEHRDIAVTRPANVRWFIRRLRNLRADQLLQIVSFVDRALNNTSVILLFEVGDQKLLFPGDAQIENWQFALSKAKENKELRDLLAGTTVYKVGHHGSRNATPKSLWKSFKNKSDDEIDTRLQTVNSTMRGKHGESDDTEVPLPKMVTAMKAKSNYVTTEDFEDGFVEPITIHVNH